MVVAAVTAVVVVEVWLRYNAVHPLRTAVQLAGMFENDADGRLRTVAHYHAEVVVDDRRVTIELNGAGGRGEFPRGGGRW